MLITLVIPIVQRSPYGDFTLRRVMTVTCSLHTDVNAQHKSVSQQQVVQKTALKRQHKTRSVISKGSFFFAPAKPAEAGNKCQARGSDEDTPPPPFKLSRFIFYASSFLIRINHFLICEILLSKWGEEWMMDCRR